MDRRQRFLLLLIAAFGWACSSGGGNEPPPPPTPAEITEQGWRSYSNRQYQASLERFSAALQADAEYVDAYNGAGWANAKLNALQVAIDRFTTGLTKQPSNLEMKAGLAFVYNAFKSLANNYLLSINQARAVLEANANWSFSRDASINHADLHVLMAEDFFAIAQFDSSLAHVRAINPNFNADVSTIAGQTDLAREIERLQQSVY